MDRQKVKAPLGLAFAGECKVDRINAGLHGTESNRSFFHIPARTANDLGISNGDRVYVVVYSPVGPFITPKKVARYGNAVRVMITVLEREMAELEIDVRYQVLLVPWGDGA